MPLLDKYSRASFAEELPWRILRVRWREMMHGMKQFGRLPVARLPWRFALAFAILAQKNMGTVKRNITKK